MPLPREVSIIKSWYSREVIRSNCIHEKRGVIICIGLTSGEGPDTNLPEITMGALIFTNWVTDSQENPKSFEKVRNSLDWCKERLKRWIVNHRIRDP